MRLGEGGRWDIKAENSSIDTLMIHQVFPRAAKCCYVSKGVLFGPKSTIKSSQVCGT